MQQGLTGLQLPVNVQGRCDGDILHAKQLVDEVGEETGGSAGNGPKALLALVENGGGGSDLCGVGDFGQGRECREREGAPLLKPPSSKAASGSMNKHEASVVLDCPVVAL